MASVTMPPAWPGVSQPVPRWPEATTWNGRWKGNPSPWRARLRVLSPQPQSEPSTPASSLPPFPQATHTVDTLPYLPL